MPVDQPLILWFRDVGIGDVPFVGGKNASLGEMLRELAPLGQGAVRVPDGFAVTAAAYRLHTRTAGLEEWIDHRLRGLDAGDPGMVAAAGADIRQRIGAAPLPEAMQGQVIDAYRTLSGMTRTTERGGSIPTGDHWLDVAVRSSATAEDLPTASFAGQHDTYLNIRGPENLEAAVRACMASLYTDRAIVYRINNKFDHRAVALSVGVQRMVRADIAEPHGGCAGTMFTLDTESGFRGVVMIDASWGLGETVVQGRVNPDEYWIHKETLRAGFRPVIRKELGEKAVKLVYTGEGLMAARSVREVAVPTADRVRLVLTDAEALELARWATEIEDHYTKRAGSPAGGVPMDLEWAKDGRTGELFILQARPETVHSQRTAGAKLEVFKVTTREPALLTGKSVGSRVGAGPVRVVRSAADLPTVRKGDVLVAPMTDPDWEPVLRNAAAVITDRGGRTCHAAIVSREMGLPCVVGTGHATEALHNTQLVTVSGAEGDIGNIYSGLVPFTREEVDPAALPAPRVPLMLNLADPARAFQLGQLPAATVAGVGLMRIEFLINNRIGIHPMALVHPELVTDPAECAEIRARTIAFASPTEFFVDRLASGIAQIGAAFYPRPVIVRFSDFKTNEYANLLGGAAFEPKEENPMIGFRGASRYYDDRYREGFALECAAIRRVREDMGLTNVIVMIPFCRTLTEARLVLDEMGRHGLKRGENGMQVYVMCEIPNNVILADEFSDLFDGFSIGSNDLTQLTLGVDRDSDLLTHIFDERDPGVRRLIETVIARAHAKGRKVGICGEAPSNYPDFAEWLASIGIDSMSLNPDSLLGVARRLVAECQTKCRTGLNPLERTTWKAPSRPMTPAHSVAKSSASAPTSTV
ncbi:MAG TPA: phosphoenolpyruvate synthase [Phycisphaerales bacterium]|nr:phosphoenolpyruvate synthase [Phycisphaerales bacterium]